MAVEPFAVGFDLGKEYSQICCWNADTKEPVSISVVAGAEKYRIPTESLELFLKKAMRLLKPFGKVHEAEAVVFSVEETAEERVEEIRRTAMQLMGVPESRIFVQTREESFWNWRNIFWTVWTDRTRERLRWDMNFTGLRETKIRRWESC